MIKTSLTYSYKDCSNAEQLQNYIQAFKDMSESLFKPVVFGNPQYNGNVAVITEDIICGIVDAVTIDDSKPTVKVDFTIDDSPVGKAVQYCVSNQIKLITSTICTVKDEGKFSIDAILLTPWAPK